jgi:trehalose 2-sulfotransferase
MAPRLMPRSIAPPCADVSRGELRQSYVVLSTPRTGSYLLCEGLLRTGLAGYPLEYFGARCRADLMRCRPSALMEYLQMLHRLALTNCAGILGLKLTWRQLSGLCSDLALVPALRQASPSEILECVFPRLRYIRVTRNDKVRQAISLWRAFETGRWADHGMAQEAPRPQERYNRQGIAAMLARIEGDEAAISGFLAQNGIQRHTVAYEDLVARYPDEVVGVLRFLDLCPSQLTVASPRLVKQGDDVTETWVERFNNEAPHAPPAELDIGA